MDEGDGGGIAALERVLLDALEPTTASQAQRRCAGEPGALLLVWPGAQVLARLSARHQCVAVVSWCPTHRLRRSFQGLGEATMAAALLRDCLREPSVVVQLQ